MRIATALLLLAAAAAAGCADGPGGGAADPAELPRPAPDLSALEPTLRKAVEDTQDRLAVLAQDPEADPAEVGEAFGALGQLYHAYDLLDASRTAYRNASALRPDDYRWPYLEGLAAQQAGDHLAAEERLRHALELEARSVPVWLHLGDLQLDQNRVEEATVSYRRALELEPDTAAAVYRLANAEVAAGDLEAALEHYQRALELAPYANLVHYPLAQIYRRLDRSEEAARHLELSGRRDVAIEDPVGNAIADLRTLTSFRVVRDLAADPGDVTPEELLAIALTQLGRVEGTIPQLERVLQARAADPAAPPGEVARLHYVLGGLLVRHDRDREAVDHFARAVELAPELTDAAIKLGDGLARTGRLPAAVEVYSRLLARQPDHADARLKRATALLNLGRVEEGRRELTALLAERPADPVLLARLAESYEVAGDPRQAEASFRRGLAGDLPDLDRARLHRSFGDFWRRRGRLEAAVEQYETAAALDAAFVGARLELARTLGLLERYDEAAAAYRQVIRLETGHHDARLGEAAALILGGRLGEARRRLEEAVATLPDDPTATHLLARLLAAAPTPEVRDGQRAVELAETAFALAPGAGTAATVAMAYAETGRFDEAVRWQERAMDGAAAADRLAQLRRRAYAERRPWRATSPEELLVERSPTTAPAPAERS